jgi:SHS2 domain-containing protein
MGLSPVTAGYREVDHTADWELHVWAPDLVGLLEQAARGMYHLEGASILPEPRRTRDFELLFHDPESLLVDFLAELLFLAENEGLGFDQFDLAITGDRLQAKLTGAPFASLAKEIKAVTYHNLALRQSDQGLEANVVFDV